MYRNRNTMMEWYTMGSIPGEQGKIFNMFQ